MGRNPLVLTLLLLVGDGAAMVASLFVALVIRQRVDQFNSFVPAFAYLYIVWFCILITLNFYNRTFLKRAHDFYISVGIFSVVAFLASVLYFYARGIPELAPKTILFLHILLFDIVFIGWRRAVDLLLESSKIKEHAIVVGENASLKSIWPKLETIYQLHTVADSALLRDALALEKATSVIIGFNGELPPPVLRQLLSTPSVRHMQWHDVYEFIERKVPLDDIDEAWFFVHMPTTQSLWSEVLKRAIDMMLGVVGLIITAIVYPWAALLIKIDSPGPIFYRQERVGKHGIVFTMYKFRTMYQEQSGQMQLWREKNNNTITPVGKILRRLHIDELPQSWCLVKGDISFVGPRPEWMPLAKIFEEQIPFYRQRYAVKPGIIGWAQINVPPSRSVPEAAEKFKYDLYYIKNRSLLLDLEIMLKAVKLFFW